MISRIIHRIRIILEMIKFEHTVFALPYAIISTALAIYGLGYWPIAKFLWILVAMVGARSSAMAFNRVVDLEIDRKNPRTANRALPAGILTTTQVWIFILVTTAVFILAAGMLNRLALVLSPVGPLVIPG